MPIWLPKNFLGSAEPVGKLINTCETACTMAGYPTVHVSSCGELLEGYKGKYTVSGIRLCVANASRSPESGKTE